MRIRITATLALTAVLGYVQTLTAMAGNTL